MSREDNGIAYFTGQTHDLRATLWTIGSLIIVFMTVTILVHGISLV